MRIKSIQYFVAKMEKKANLKGPNNSKEMQNYKIAEYLTEKIKDKKVA
jgi:hypothetical protein